VGKTFLVRSVLANQRSPYFELVGRFGGSTKEHLGLFAGFSRRARALLERLVLSSSRHRPGRMRFGGFVDVAQSRQRTR
jgi:hypothetical protein